MIKSMKRFIHLLLKLMNRSRYLLWRIINSRISWMALKNQQACSMNRQKRTSNPSIPGYRKNAKSFLTSIWSWSKRQTTASSPWTRTLKDLSSNWQTSSNRSLSSSLVIWITRRSSWSWIMIHLLQHCRKLETNSLTTSKKRCSKWKRWQQLSSPR